MRPWDHWPVFIFRVIWAPGVTPCAGPKRQNFPDDSAFLCENFVKTACDLGRAGGRQCGYAPAGSDMTPIVGLNPCNLERSILAEATATKKIVIYQWVEVLRK